MLQFECPLTFRNRYYSFRFVRIICLGVTQTCWHVVKNISLSSCLYWYATLNSCKYLKSETHLWNAQVNKASPVNKGIVKTSLIADMVRKNWSWMAVAGCGLHYFVSASFGSFRILANFRIAERFKYLFFTTEN